MTMTCPVGHDPFVLGEHVPDWSVRSARTDDRRFLLDLNEATMRAYVDATWGWDDDEQRAFFDRRFNPADCQIVCVGNMDVGVLWVEERADEIYLATIQVLPEWQGKGIGSSVVTALVERGAAEGKPVTLRVLRANRRAAALYARLGFERSCQSDTHIYLRRAP